MSERHSNVETISAAVQEPLELRQLKQYLEGYRELMLPFNRVLEWDQNYYPVVLVGSITLIFSIIWYMEPSVLTAFCIIGFLVCAFDFAVAFLKDRILRSDEWTAVQERQFDAMCQRILNGKLHICHFKQSLLGLKQSKPKAYLLTMMGTFAIMAWFGSLIDNLLLTYLIVVTCTLVPGLRKHGILQKAVAVLNDKIAAARKQQQQPEVVKPKTG